MLQTEMQQLNQVLQACVLFLGMIILKLKLKINVTLASS